MVQVLAYGCVSAAGSGVGELWKSLCSGTPHAQIETGEGWRKPPDFPVKTYRFPEKQRNLTGHEPVKNLLLGHLKAAFDEALPSLPPGAAEKNWGVILASTKGCVEDFIWDGSREGDPYTPILEGFIQQSSLRVPRSVCVSNACASSLCALGLGKHWLTTHSELDYVLILAADFVGPFVVWGFQSFRALSGDCLRPFSGDRNGLQLGEAAAAIVLGSPMEAKEGAILLEGVGMDTEGYAATRPSRSGESLRKACERALPTSRYRPDLVIAHGTATPINDAIEDEVLTGLWGEGERSVLTTSVKWCVGHTLGASAAMDAIAACEVLNHGRAFAIGTTQKADPALKGRYFTSGSTGLSVPPRSVLVTSLGFGGTHAAAVFSRKGEN